MENYSNGEKRHNFFPKEDHKLMVRDVNNFFICTLCKGYLVDATGLVECAHIYCRSCIVQFLKTNSKCPVCEISLNKEDPFLSLRPDQIVQRLVYKAIPGLYKKELLQRKLYFNNSEVENIIISDDESTTKQCYFDSREPISICLEYIESSRIDTEENVSKLNEIGIRNHFNESLLKASHMRYLQCPAALRIRTLLKWIREKYNLHRNHEVEILYNKIKLPSYFSIMDVAYTFLWKRDSPMHLGYQIFKQNFMKVPLNVRNTILNGNIPTQNNSVMETLPLDSSNEEGKPLRYAANFENTSKNLKHKSNTADLEKITNTSDLGFGEPTVKIPRISSSLLKEETNDMKSAELQSLEKLDSPKLENRSHSNDSGLFLDDYKYEQDIEEIVDDGDDANLEDNDNDDDDDDDDDDDNRLQILDLPDNKHDDISQQLIIDTLDEGREQKMIDKKTKNKKKNKKSKHHKHHHRRHERRKGAPQATILHSPDTDIMKLKVKLNNVKSDAKYNKQNHKKSKRSPDSYFSTSSNCSESSILLSSPDTNNTSKADEELIQSQISELSDESNATISVDEESILKIPKEQKDEITREPILYGTNIAQSLTSKEKLLQMRAFRPKNIAVVKPEENDKTSAIFSKNDNNNNNDKVPLGTFEVNASNKTPSGIAHPASSSSITVSKITAAEKLLMEQEKKMNSSNNNDKPSLEITLVTEPSKIMAVPVPTTSACLLNLSKNNQLPQRSMKPVPPLYQLAVRSNEMNKCKAPSIQPYMRHIPSSQLQSTNMPSNNCINNSKKKVNDSITAIRPDGMKQSVTISLSGSMNRRDFPSALNLSGKPHFSHSIASLTCNEPNSSKLQVKSNKLMTSSTNNYNPVSSMSSLTENMNLYKYSAANIPHKLHMMGYPIISTMPNNDGISCASSMLHKPQGITYPVTNKMTKTANIPPLNEIRLGPTSTFEVFPKPRPNQSVRNIPNPSHVRRRYHPYSTIAIDPIISPTSNESIEASMMRHIVSTSCSLGNFKEVAGKCSPVIPKSCTEQANIMATK